jgi:hypothetical protein
LTLYVIDNVMSVMDSKNLSSCLHMTALLV